MVNDNIVKSRCITIFREIQEIIKEELWNIKDIGEKERNILENNLFNNEENDEYNNDNDNENEVQIENDNYNNYNDGDEKVVEIERDENDDSENYKDWPDGAIKMNRSEKYIIENGKEMIIIKTIYIFSDGHTESVIEKEKID